MSRTISDLVTGMIAPLKRRVSLMITRAVIKSVNDAGGIQALQISLYKDEIRDQFERFQNYGFTSNPKPGAEACSVFFGGDRGNGIVVAIEDRRYRLRGLESGEVAIYTDEGDKIVLKRNNTIEIDTHTLNVNATTKVNITSPEVDISGDLKVTGNISAANVAASAAMTGATVADSTGSMDTIRTKYNSHTHPGGLTPSPTM